MEQSISAHKKFLEERFNIVFEEGDVLRNPALHPIEDAPAGSLIIVNALYKGEIIGRHVLVPYFLRTENGNAKIALSSASEVKEKYRGIGVFPVLFLEAIKRAREQGIKFIYGFPNENSYNNIVNDLQFKTIGVLPILVKPINSKKILQKILYNSRTAAWLDVFVRPFVGLLYLAGRARASGSVSIKTSDRLGEGLDSLWSTRENISYYMVLRDSSFLAWRYNKDAFIRFTGCDKVTGENGIIIGCVRLKFGFKIGFITELLLPRANAHSLGGQLIREIENYFRKEQVDFIAAACTRNTMLHKSLSRAWYFTLPQRYFQRKFWVVGKHLDETAENLYQFDKWAITLSDFDNV